jgi:hypothetical protein
VNFYNATRDRRTGSRTHVGNNVGFAEQALVILGSVREHLDDLGSI